MSRQPHGVCCQGGRRQGNRVGRERATCEQDLDAEGTEDADYRHCRHHDAKDRRRRLTPSYRKRVAVTPRGLGSKRRKRGICKGHRKRPQWQHHQCPGVIQRRNPARRQVCSKPRCGYETQLDGTLANQAGHHQGEDLPEVRTYRPAVGQLRRPGNAKSQ